MSIDYPRPSTWRMYGKNLCSTCRADCCRLPVEVHLSELPGLGLAHEKDAEYDLEGLIKRLKKQGMIRLFDRQKGYITLAQKPDDSCIFLDNTSRCRIYPVRPQTCRNFPAKGPRPDYCPWRQKKG
jgi:uncharacterized protein